MKVALLIVAVAIAGVFAEDASSGPPPFVCDGNAFLCKFKELGHHIKYHAKKLGNNLLGVGNAVLDSALKQGSDLLASGTQAVLGTVLDHMTKEGLVGKREFSFFDTIRGHVSTGMELIEKAKGAIHTAFTKAVQKITGVMSNMAGLKNIEDDADKQIDDAVEEFKKDGKKGFLSMAATIAKKLQSVVAEGLAKIKSMFSKKAEDKRAIFGFDSVSDAWQKAKQHLSGAAGAIADTFKPHIAALTGGISDLADKVKGHAGNLVDAAKDSFTDLTNKLGEHVETLKGHASKLGDHATNAVNALKEAIAAIASQAVGNAKNTISDIAKTGSDAAGTVVKHVGDAMAGN